MINLSKNILLYSNYCNFSKNFYQNLSQNKDIMASFEFISVDVNPSTKTRDPLFFEIQRTLGMKVKEVPTIIVENGQYMLSGKEAFKWLEYTQSQKSELEIPAELQGYNCLEMGSFSDQYSRFGSNQMNDATDQIYKFLDKADEPIQTPQEENELTSDAFERKQNERESFVNVPRKQISTPNKIMPVSSTKSFMGNTDTKKKDLDKRYQELLNERDNLLPKPQRMEPQQLDFQTGKVYY